MLKKWGKFYARWTGPEGKRHSKTFRTKAAAARHQRAMVVDRTAKKARPRGTSARSSARGSRSRPHSTTSTRSANSQPKRAISPRRSSHRS